MFTHLYIRVDKEDEEDEISLLKAFIRWISLGWFRLVKVKLTPWSLFGLRTCTLYWGFLALSNQKKSVLMQLT